MDHMPFYFGGDRMYVSTISSLISDPLQIRIEAGEYILKPYFGGFVYTKTTYEPQFLDIAKVLNTRDGDPGLSGTYHHGFTDNKDIIKVVNDHFSSFVDVEYYKEDVCDDFEYFSDESESDEEDSDEEYVVEEDDDEDIDDENSDDEDTEDCEDIEDDEEIEYDEVEEMKDEVETGENHLLYKHDDDDNKSEKAKEEKEVDWLHYLHLCAPTPPKKVKPPYVPRVTKLPDYHNFPVLFFLNSEAVVENLNLEKEYEDEDHAVWNVIDCDKGKIGVAIGQKRFHDMMGDQMGLAAFSVDGTRAVAFANFEADENVPASVIDTVFYPSHEKNLQYNPYDVPWNRTKKNKIKVVQSQVPNQ